MIRTAALWSLLSVFVMIPSVDAGIVIGEYRFEEGSPNGTATTVIDSSGFGNHGIASGTPIYRAIVPVNPIPQSGESNGLSLEFDSSKSDFVFVDSEFVFNRPGDGTLEFWINAPDQGHAAIFWGRPDIADANRFHIFLSGSPEGVPQPGLAFGMDYREPDGTLHTLGSVGKR